MVPDAAKVSGAEGPSVPVAAAAAAEARDPAAAETRGLVAAVDDETRGLVAATAAETPGPVAATAAETRDPVAAIAAETVENRPRQLREKTARPTETDETDHDDHDRGHRRQTTDQLVPETGAPGADNGQVQSR